MALTIAPQTDGVLRVRVQDAAGVLVPDATVVADVYLPSGRKVADDVVLTNAGSGNYDLEVLAAWSTHQSGAAIQGEFRAVVKATRGEYQAVGRVKYLVRFAA